MKIKYSLLNNLKTLTNKEMDFVLYVARIQDDAGHVRGVYYRDVCEKAGMCKQKFYEVIRSLQDKNIITYTHTNDCDFDITILNNDFSYRGSLNEGYVNLSREVFHTKYFKELKVKEKWLLLEFLKLSNNKNKSHQIGTDNFYNKYKHLLGVTKRVVRGYLHTMKRFFSIGCVNGKYYITYRAKVMDPRITDAYIHGSLGSAEVDYYYENEINRMCRHYHIKRIEEDARIDVIGVIKRYRERAKLQGKNILDVIEKGIYFIAKGKRERFSPAYLNKLTKQALNLS